LERACISGTVGRPITLEPLPLSFTRLHGFAQHRPASPFPPKVKLVSSLLFSPPFILQLLLCFFSFPCTFRSLCHPFFEFFCWFFSPVESMNPLGNTIFFPAWGPNAQLVLLPALCRTIFFFGSKTAPRLFQVSISFGATPSSVPLVSRRFCLLFSRPQGSFPSRTKIGTSLLLPRPWDPLTSSFYALLCCLHSLPLPLSIRFSFSLVRLSAAAFFLPPRIHLSTSPDPGR